MKLSFKIFTISFLLVITLLGISGFVIINSNFNNELLIEETSVLNDNKFMSMVISSISNNDFDITDENYYDGKVNNYSTSNYIIKMFQNISNNGKVFIGVNNLKFASLDYLSNINEGEQVSRILSINDEYFFQVISKLNVNEEILYVENLSSLSPIYEMRDDNYKFYSIFLIIGSLISSTILYVFSIYITKPLKKLIYNSNLIAEGNFSIRNNNSLKSMKSFELVSLATQFNNMAKKIESYIEELQDYNKRQDDFISKFTHELKTPLTSIIGYADILRTYDVDPKKRRELSNYIYKEGKRLEELTFHLLDLIILKNDKFDFKEYNSKFLFKEIDRSVIFLVNKYDVNLEYNIEEKILLIEPVLLKSLIYNLIDNACKATLNNKNIIITGKVIGNRYNISVKDNGKGIDKSNLDRVTEPFFMEDKSRARKEGGSGLGLSLAKSIANIHGSDLVIESELGVGTKVSFEVGVKL